MNINIIAIGNIKEKYLKDGIAEYSKRISKYANLSIIELPEILIKDESNKSIARALDKEAESILSKVNPKDFVILLDLNGKYMDNVELVDLLDNKKLEGYNDFTFIIGSSYGTSSIVKNISNLKLKFSPLTFPHQLMRLILLEQIYRTFKIMAHEPYHK